MKPNVTSTPDRRRDLTYLLLQVRKPDDPMRENELQCFARGLGCSIDRIVTHDLIAGPPPQSRFDRVDAVLVGGSGDF